MSDDNELVSQDIENINKPEQLNALTFPLYGNRLIEASAGTGKTFTITSLYIRILLGHGGENANQGECLTVDKILVVTFTEAATEELKDRIRRRIKDVRYAFLRGSSKDPFIQSVIDETPNHEQATQTLLQAERQMDEAAIFTIHGFCQKMLTQNAFESGSDFEYSFLTDESKVKNDVVSDYWRTHFYSASLGLSSEIRKITPSPQALLKKIDRYLSGESIHVKSPISDVSSIDFEEIHSKNYKSIDDLKEKWKSASDEVIPTITQSTVSKRSFSTKNTQKWVDEINAWAQTETDTYAIPSSLEKFSSTNLIEKSKSEDTAPHHPVFASITNFFEQKPSLESILIKHAISECRNLLTKAKERVGVLSFDDLLSKLSAALKGSNRWVLAGKIRALFPIALIDEFQDTDPMQYYIFHSIYGEKFIGENNKKVNGLFIIGDPKQAIYAFRGADIFTYIKARREITNHYTLGTNWRSSERMVNAVNKLFTNSDSPFIYDEDIQFLETNVSPVANSMMWTIDGIKRPALTLWSHNDEKPTSKEEYVKALSTATATEINHILTKSKEGEALLFKKGESETIQAGNIAVLVRTGIEARKVKDELAKQGIASVYLSNRESVFLSNEAKEILIFMLAVNDYTNERKIRSALATRLIGVSAEELISIEEDELKWEAVINEFIAYNTMWQRRGIMPTILNLINNRKLAELTLSEIDGDRQMTNILHLAENLEETSIEIESQHGLIRYLHESINTPPTNQDTTFLRLESEDNLVKIITIHKSKGLEYDLVFVPFMSSYKESTTGFYHDSETNKGVLDNSGNKYALIQSEKERLAEDLRLAYVAITRAVYGAYIGLTPIRDGRKTAFPSGVHKSAIGHLLLSGKAVDSHELLKAMDSLSDRAGPETIAVSPLPENNLAPYEPAADTVKEYKPKIFKAKIIDNWYVTSYSNLSSQGGHGSHYEHIVDIDAIETKTTDELGELEEPEKTIFNFYKGAQPGTFLHTIFEEIDFQKSVYSEETAEIINDLLLVEGYEDYWLPILQEMIENVLNRPLNDDGLMLSNIPPEMRLTEMEFMIPIKDLKAHKVNTLIRKHDPMSKGLPDLGFYDVTGMLKGFIDLTFQAHDGKFYVLDWKSNHLGDNHAYYTQEAMMLSMQDHRYEFQYQIYSLALQLFLKTKIPNYSYEEHFGGVYYVYLRGVESEGDNGIFFTRPSMAFLDEFESLINDIEITHV